MPALVTHPDTSSYQAPLARTPYKRYETRSSTSAVTPKVESDHRPISKKYTAPSSLLMNANSQDPIIKIPVVVEEVQEIKPVEPIPVTAAVAPMSKDAPRRSLHRDQLTPSEFRLEVLDPGCKEFASVKAQEFEFIQYAVGETDKVLKKPRLTYNYTTLLLTIKMPSTLHEEPFDYLKDCLTFAIGSLPYDRDVIRPMVYMNYDLELEDQAVTPDMTIGLTSVDGPTEVILISALGECALLEDTDHAFDKMEAEILAHPETILAAIVVIHEAITYKSPDANSTAFTALHNWR
ncbi:hypothetical protein EV702DRAFT_1195140 [Suillus placidus]|uniref:Uncharacterized protein n=1 Tax=Suillus placidus TaxID=48579 RepID=A0A9P7A055_9AGAM|nr:hypothetical protein EV702DRAFT_1195140 [Suillus placidus]